MTYNVLAVCENGEENFPAYPALNDDIQVVTEIADGPLGQALRATKIVIRRKIGNSYKNVMETKDIDFQVWVTNSRVIMYCKKFEKGGGWVGFGLGGLAVAVVANSVSMAIAANRRKGKALVGNLRYPWISAVMFSPRNGFGTEEQVRLHYVDGTDDSRPECDITLTLARGSDASRVARSVVDRIIAYRYSSGEQMSADELASFEELRTSGLAARPAKGILGSYTIPTSWRVPLGMPAGTPSGLPAMASVPEIRVKDVPISVVPSADLVRPTLCEGCGSAELGLRFCTDCGEPVVAAIA